MAIKPILFNTEMVQAILRGDKTTTRRAIKPQPENCMNDELCGLNSDGTYSLHVAKHLGGVFFDADKRIVPPYHPGDVLWVRETWSTHYTAESNGELVYCYKADGEDLQSECLPGENNRWNPSIHMPKAAARIFLRVKSVRAERLQNGFTQESPVFALQKEGIDIGDQCRKCIDDYGCPCCCDNDGECGSLDDVRSNFADLWNSTIKKTDLPLYGWAANPWVWVIEFGRCEKPEGWCDNATD